MADVDRLFDEFAAAYVRGEQPDLVAFVRLAGEDGDELARLIDVFLRVAPAPEPRDDDVAVMRAGYKASRGCSHSAGDARARSTRSWRIWPSASRSTTSRG